MEKASLHHFHYRSADYFDDTTHDEAWFDHRRARRTVIGHDTWLGHGAQVCPDVTIGHGAVIAGGAIVTKDVEPYTIVAGIPERMVALAWWDWQHERLKETLNDFRSLSAEAFLERYEE